MKRKYILIIALATIIFFSEYAIMASWLASITYSSEIQDVNNLYDIRFTNIQYYNDSLSDSNGNRAFTWGIEVWSGSPSSYFTPGQVNLTGHSLNDALVLAIPDPIDKPIVTAGVSYTQAFEIKLDNVQGHGVRLIYQSFNSSNAYIWPTQIVYGKWETGTSGWHTIYLTATPINGSVRGDVICELWGTGTVYIRNPEFHITTIVDTLNQISIQISINSITPWIVAGLVIVILSMAMISILSLIVVPLRRKENELLRRLKHQKITESGENR
ncbi:MAG: hypothetical protein ABSB40_04470 [Nitrososphaeria archaeon]|jgi:hypothetical protein